MIDEEEIRVDRCDCINKRFADLQAYGSFEAAQEATDCGRECGGCVPYIKLMFATGETDFDMDDPRLRL
jgi:NAD(P)H-nitrite reductase large subunit